MGMPWGKGAGAAMGMPCGEGAALGYEHALSGKGAARAEQKQTPGVAKPDSGVRGDFDI
jgi:hypothetical protein